MENNIVETLVWAGTAGGVLTLCLVVVLDFVLHRSRASAQLLVYMLVFGACALIMGGLPGPLWPGWVGPSLTIVQVVAGPMAGTLALIMLRVWVGGNRDRMSHWATTSGVVVMTAGAAALLLVAVGQAGSDPLRLFQAGALLNAGTIVLGTLVAARAALLGDRLAWRMVLGCGLAALVASGLEAKLLGVGIGGWPLKIATAAGVLLYLIVIAWAVMQRGAQHRNLKARLGLATEKDALTRLPVGAGLLALIESGLRCSARFQRDCAVLAVSIGNLHELRPHAGHELGNEVALALSLRIRAAVGLRDVVGLYHPGCFIVVVAAIQTPATVRKLGLRLAAALRRNIALTGMRPDAGSFKPDVGVGVIRMSCGRGDAGLALEEAESVASYARRLPSRAAISSLAGDDLHPLETYDFRVRPPSADNETLVPPSTQLM